MEADLKLGDHVRYCEHNRMGDPCGPDAGTCLDCGEACSCGEDLIHDHDPECPIHADLTGGDDE